MHGISAGRHFVALLAILLAGCATVSLDGDKKTPQVRTSTSITSSRIDMLMPKVLRTGPMTADISFDLVGDFEITDVRTTPGVVTGGRHVAFGFFPGAAPCDDTMGKIGTALEGVWYNVCFFGTPTLAGLLVGPFAETGTSAFSRSALFGAYRWSTAKQKSQDRTVSDRRNKESIPLEGVQFIVDDYQLTRRDHGFSISGLPSGRQTVNVALAIPNDHPMGKQLQQYCRGTIPVIVPEEDKP